MGWFSGESDMALFLLLSCIETDLDPDDSDEAKAYNEWDQAPHKAELSHELIAGAAAFEAAKAWEKHQEENGTVALSSFTFPVSIRLTALKSGKPENHALAKELLAGFAGAAVDRLVETKGLDYLDREKAKHHAKERLEEQLAGEYN